MYELLTNPNKNFYTTRKKQISNIVLHVTAGLEDLDLLGIDNSAEATNRYGATTNRSASWHCCVDSDSICPSIPDAYTAFHCIGYNAGTLGLEICNRDARWDNKPDNWIQATLLNAAHVTLAWETAHRIPRVLLPKSEVDAHERGYTYHSYLDPVRRHDPGTTFPWIRFTNILQSLEGPAVGPVVTVPQGVDRMRTHDIQSLFKLKGDGLWGAATDRRADLMVAACRSMAGYRRARPGAYKISSVQYIIGSAIDGRWGNESQAALEVWIKAIQEVLHVTRDGSWGPVTDKAFDDFRKQNAGRF